MSNTYFYVFLLYLNVCYASDKVDPKFTKVWGPGLRPNEIVMPARYFMIESRNSLNQRLNSSLIENFKVTIEGLTKEQKPCRIWMNNLNRHNGSYIIRYKVFDTCSNLKISVKYLDEDVAESPYESIDVIPDQCHCPKIELNDLIKTWDCGYVPRQIENDMNVFDGEIDWTTLREKIVTRFDKPYSVSLCHYVIKDNTIYRRCYGKYVGFKMFMDSILLSLGRKAFLPDMEFFVNLGDWPLVSKNDEKLPIFSWCGSTDTFDIVMPTYDLTESTLENMGRVMLDMLSVQGNVPQPWEKRIPKVFWRGRDSSRERLKLIEISRQFPHLFNCSLTNFFFFKDEEHVYGPKAEHVSFYSFFNYKYQLGLDGTVAAYRFPYLLTGGSLVFKQESKYYEHFYNDLLPNVHYIPIKRNLDDLVEKIHWAMDNDEEAKKIAENARTFSNRFLLPKNIFCYYSRLLSEFREKIVSPIEVLDGMEKVDKLIHKEICDCDYNFKDEL